MFAISLPVTPEDARDVLLQFANGERLQLDPHGVCWEEMPRELEANPEFINITITAVVILDEKSGPGSWFDPIPGRVYEHCIEEELLLRITCRLHDRVHMHNDFRAWLKRGRTALFTQTATAYAVAQ